MHRESPSVSVLLLTTVFMLPAAAVRAQTPQAATGELEEVIVTAQRQEETAQRAAVALSVVSPDQIARAGVLRPEDLSQVVPALQSGGGGGVSVFFIRGVGTYSVNSYTDPAIAFNYDDVYVGRPTGTAGFFYDLERLEVLKGPQGTLYGRNATGGAINVIPARPVLGKNSGNFTIEGGNYDRTRVDGAANLALGDNTALRLAGIYSEHSGYNSDGGDGERNYAGRAQLAFAPSDDLSVRLATDYAHIGGAGVGGLITGYISNDDYNAFLSGATLVPTATPAPYPVGTGANDPRTTSLLSTIYSGSVAGRNLGPLSATPQLDTDQFGLNAQVEWNVGAGTLVVIPAYRESDLGDNRNTGGAFVALTQQKDNQSSLEVRFASPQEGKLQYLLGGYYFDEEIHSKYAFNQFVLLASQDVETSTESGAVFGRVTFAPVDPLRFVLGARYTRDRKTFDADVTTMLDACTNVASPPACPTAPLIPNAFTEQDVVQSLQLIPVTIPGFTRAYVLPSAPGTVFGVFATQQTTERTDKKTTWHGGVEYDLSPASLLYANVETGFHGGGFSVVSDSRSSFAPETITAYTVGAKNRFLDNRLQVNMELFLWKYRDQQVSHFAVDANTHASVYITENVGRSTNQGAELDVQYLVTPSTLLGADLQYLDTEYDDFRYVNAGTAITGCDVIGARNNPNGLSTIDCSGREALRSPKWTLNLSAQQTFAIGNNQVIVGANTHYQSSSMGYLDYLPEETLDSYWRSNAFATYQWGSDRRYELTAFVNNIEDDRLASSQFNSLLHIFSATALPPRTYGVRLRAEF